MNLAPLWKDYDDGHLDMFQVTVILSARLGWSASQTAGRYTAYVNRRRLRHVARTNTSRHLPGFRRVGVPYPTD